MKIKLLEALKNVVKDDSDQWVDADVFCTPLQIQVYDFPTDLQDRMKEYWIIKWYCTDTWVGLRAVYFDNEPVASIWQGGRKSGQQVEFVSRDAALKLRNYLLSNEGELSFDIINPDEEIEQLYTVEYTSQLLADTGIYQDKPVKVVEKIKYTYNDPSSEWKKIVVEDEQGVKTLITTHEFFIPISVVESSR